MEKETQYNTLLEVAHVLDNGFFLFTEDEKKTSLSELTEEELQKYIHSIANYYKSCESLLDSELYASAYSDWRYT